MYFYRKWGFSHTSKIPFYLHILDSNYQYAFHLRRGGASIALRFHHLYLLSVFLYDALRDFVAAKLWPAH